MSLSSSTDVTFNRRYGSVVGCIVESFIKISLAFLSIKTCFFHPMSSNASSTTSFALAYNLSSFLPSADNILTSRLFGASQKGFVLCRVLQNISTNLHVNTVGINGVADLVGESPAPYWSHQVLQTQDFKHTLSQMVEGN